MVNSADSVWIGKWDDLTGLLFWLECLILVHAAVFFFLNLTSFLVLCLML
jgi:hypothetical protein